MIVIPSSCNARKTCALIDYAYLSLNVYHDAKDNAILGRRPKIFKWLSELVTAIEEGKNGWAQLQFPGLPRPTKNGMYAEMYVKIYKGSIHHIMVAFRGTCDWSDGKEDAKTWYKSVLAGDDAKIDLMDYWPSVVSFMVRVKNIILDLEEANLLDARCDSHVTGHSLGGALATMVVASGGLWHPAVSQMKSPLPIMPKAISFNAPGIGAMPVRCSSEYCTGQVISLRATYDLVSAIGAPYGYVVNTDIAQGHALAKAAFESHDFKESIKKNSDNTLCNLSGICADLEAMLPIAANTIGASATYSFLEQHSMDNFMHAICAHASASAMQFMDITLWAQAHGGLNHDEKAQPLYALAA